jgi:hypothetical protein
MVECYRSGRFGAARKHHLLSKRHRLPDLS